MDVHKKHNGWKFFLIFAFFLIGMLAYDSGAVADNLEAEQTWPPDADGSLLEEQDAPGEEKPEVRRLGKVKGVVVKRYSTHSVKVSWKACKKAKFYHIYRSKEKNGDGKLAGVTKDEKYIVKKLKNNTDYYFYVVASEKKTPGETDGPPSARAHMRTKTFVRKTIIAGDSIARGITDYNMLGMFDMKGKKEVVAAVGLNTVTFRTRRAFGGMSGLRKVIDEKPSRVYMMLGMNEVYYRNIDDMINDYAELAKAIKQSAPDTDVVLCAISPVTREVWQGRKGFSQIPVFNKKLKKMTKKIGCEYFDYTDFLKGADGFLNEEYAQKDGYHWVSSVYPKFAKTLSKFDKSLDE